MRGIAPGRSTAVTESSSRLSISMIRARRLFAVRNDDTHRPWRQGRTDVLAPAGTHPVADHLEALAGRYPYAGVATVVPLLKCPVRRRRRDRRQTTVRPVDSGEGTIAELPSHLAFLAALEPAVVPLVQPPVTDDLPREAGAGRHDRRRLQGALKNGTEDVGRSQTLRVEEGSRGSGRAATSLGERRVEPAAEALAHADCSDAVADEDESGWCRASRWPQSVGSRVLELLVHQFQVSVGRRDHGVRRTH